MRLFAKQKGKYFQIHKQKKLVFAIILKLIKKRIGREEYLTHVLV